MKLTNTMTMLDEEDENRLYIMTVFTDMTKHTINVKYSEMEQVIAQYAEYKIRKNEYKMPDYVFVDLLLNYG